MFSESRARYPSLSMMSSVRTSSLALAALAVARVAAAQATATSTQVISLPTARPADAFAVPPDFLGVGFESAYLPSYDNDFSENLVDSLASRLAAPPVIRIGGTSGWVPHSCLLISYRPIIKATVTNVLT